MGLSSTLIFVAFAYLTSLSHAVSPCAKNQAPVAWLPDPDSCDGFHVCVGQSGFSLKCAEGTVWQPDLKVCCLKNSDLDKCTKSKKPLPKSFGNAEEPKTCEPGMTKKLPHSTHCGRYLDCASQGTIRGLMEEHVRECPYPQLFNRETGKCEHFSKVNCDVRTEPKNACDYLMNQCQRSHCIPCYVRFPDCTGMSNGANVWKGLEKSPRYAVCENERVVKHGRCPEGKLFHPIHRVCEEALTAA